MAENYQKRRVFFLVDSFNVGGTETQAVELARRMDPARYEVTLGCLKREGPLLAKLERTTVPVVEFRPGTGMDSPGGVKQTLRLALFLRRHHYDIVHTHDLWSNLMGIPAARLARTPVIVCSQRDLSHDPWYQSPRGRILRRIQSLASAILTNAVPVRQELCQEAGFQTLKVRVIHNGVDLECFRAAVRDRERLFPGTGQGKIVVLVGNMRSDVKGHSTLIEAAPKVVTSISQTRFVLVGEGALQGEFERQVEELGLERNFILLGRRADVPEVLAASDVAVLPSKAEGMPNALLEYLAAGLPTVATAVGGNLEVIQNGVTGLLVPTQDSDALAAALLRILDDDELAGRLGREGQEYVSANFSFEKLVKETDALYTELLDRRGSRRN
jgi:L-malate glycosyltransferase